MKKVLVLEDESSIRSFIVINLRRAGYEVIEAGTGEEALEMLQQHSDIRVALLDVMLPGKDGLSVCKDIRQFSGVPIIMLTARVEEIDRLLGLELGADDYICKPFSPREVVARVKAVLRRWESVTHASQTDTAPGALVLERDRLIVRSGQAEVSLTLVEFELLEILYKQPGRIFGRDQLMSKVYSDNRIVSDRTIDSHIKKLRKKLSEILANQEVIHSVYSVGYKFEL